MTRETNRPEDDARLFVERLALAREGDPEAIGWLLEQNRDYLLFVANQDFGHDLRRKMGVSDLVQESMAQAHNHFGRFTGATREELLAWLRGILRNDAKHWRRHYRGVEKRSRESEPDSGSRVGVAPADPWLTPRSQAVADEEAALLHQAMEQLPENWRMVIQLRNWEDQSYEEIGRKMDCSAEAARKLWSRAILRLQEYLDRSRADPDSAID